MGISRAEYTLSSDGGKDEKNIVKELGKEIARKKRNCGRKFGS